MQPSRIVTAALIAASSTLGGTAAAGPVCQPNADGIACHAIARERPTGGIAAYAAPLGLAPSDLQDAYRIQQPHGAVPTIAIIDAYGYSALESDLAMYRSQYGLPPCTIANGCLRVVRDDGSTTLPPDPPTTDDWTIETALDVDMASAACPTCKILVVQATSSLNQYLIPAQRTAVQLGATVISNSWGSGQPGVNYAATEPYFDHPGVPTFVSSGDNGYDEGGVGPHYPSTSAHVVAVGGTALRRDGSARGWSEVAWSMAGSSCSTSIAKPAYQAAVPCQFRAASDVSAVADPATGVAVYNARNGGWIEVGGTSAAAPLVATMVAAAGLAPQITGGDWFATHANALHDVVSGGNGGCATSVCNAGTGWDGPTGYGTPDMARLTDAGPMVGITAPADGATVAAGFEVDAMAAGATNVELRVDGAVISSVSSGPFRFHAPAQLAAGAHDVEVVATDANGLTDSSTVRVMVAGGSGPGAESGGMVTGGCSTGGEPGWLVLGLGALLVQRARRSRNAAASARARI